MQFAGAVKTETGYDAEIMPQLAEAQKAGYARHLGNLPANKLVAAMDAASSLVHFPAEEAFGLVVVEALARNRKLFAAATGGIVDIATGIEGMELLPADDWPGLENAIARWLAAGAPCPTTAAAMMRRLYHPEIVARRHLEIYREVINARMATGSD